MLVEIILVYVNKVNWDFVYIILYIKSFLFVGYFYILFFIKSKIIDKIVRLDF